MKENERVTITGEWEKGEMAITFVGALNVGSISLNFDPELKTNVKHYYNQKYSAVNEYQKNNVQTDINENEKILVNKLEKKWNSTRNLNSEDGIPKGLFIKKGAEMGMFNFGSTIALVFSAPKGKKFRFKEGDKVKVGQPIFPSP